MKWRYRLVLVSLVLLIGCRPPPTALPSPSFPTPSGSPLPPPSVETITITSTLTAPSSTPSLPLPADPAEAARAHLAGLLGVAVEEIAVLTVERMEMELVGLGCGQEEPLQPAIVMGTEVVLFTGERNFIYHVHGQQVVLCKGR